jgi:hypothetical protein
LTHEQSIFSYFNISSDFLSLFLNFYAPLNLDSGTRAVSHCDGTVGDTPPGKDQKCGHGNQANDSKILHVFSLPLLMILKHITPKPLYVNPDNVLNTLTKVLAEGKGGIVRFCLKAERSGRLAAGESE